MALGYCYYSLNVINKMWLKIDHSNTNLEMCNICLPITTQREMISINHCQYWQKGLFAADFEDASCV